MNLVSWLSRAIAVATLLPFMGAAWAAAPRPVAPGAPSVAGGAGATVVVLGDSLSAGYGIRVEEGWVALLGQRLTRSGYGYRVVNASVSGETSAGGLSRVAHVLAVHRPAILILELGANDGLRGLPVTDLRRNLEAIAAAARGAGATVLLVGTRIPPNYGPVYTEQYAQVFAKLARDARLPLVPFLLERIALDDHAFQADRLHPTAAVQPLLLETVWPHLEPLLAKTRRGTPAS